MDKVFKRLLGINNDGEFVFGEFGLHFQHSNPPYFSASFDCVRPFDTERIDEEYVRDWLYGLDLETKWNLCEEWDCSPSMLPTEFWERNEYSDIVDCSLYPATVEIEGVEYAFESGGCGQVDIIEEGMETFTNKAAVMRLYSLWKTYHLYTFNDEKLQEHVEKEISEIVTALDKVNEENWIKRQIMKSVLEWDADEIKNYFKTVKGEK